MAEELNRFKTETYPLINVDDDLAVINAMYNHNHDEMDDDFAVINAMYNQDNNEMDDKNRAPTASSTAAAAPPGPADSANTGEEQISFNC